MYTYTLTLVHYNTGDFILVYWAEEYQTSIASMKSVANPSIASTECECKAKAAKDLFNGEVIVDG